MSQLRGRILRIINDCNHVVTSKEAYEEGRLMNFNPAPASNVNRTSIDFNLAAFAFTHRRTQAAVFASIKAKLFNFHAEGKIRRKKKLFHLR